MKKCMKSIVILLSVAGCVVLAPTARAQGAYTGMDVVRLTSKVSGTTGGVDQVETSSSNHLRIKAGYDFSDMFGIEFQLIPINFSSFLRDTSGTPYNIKTGPIVGVYGRVEFPVGSSAGFYGLLGIATVRTDYSRTNQFGFSGGGNSDSHNGFSFGLGLEVRLSERLIGSLDWMYYHIGSASYPTYFTGNPLQVTGGLGIGLTKLY